MTRRVLAVALLALAVPGAAQATERQVAVQSTSFSPARLTVLTGDTVRWTSNDVQQHNVQGPGFGSGLMNRGDTYVAPFASRGSVFYRCTIHAFMTGTISVYELYLRGPVGTLAYGRSASFAGLAPENASVTIERIGGGAVATAQAGPGGSFSATVPGVPGLYRATTAAGRVSDVLRVRVRPRMTIGARRAGTRAVVTVGTTPSQGGGTIVLEKRAGRGWGRVASKRLNASSKAVFRVALGRGSTSFRARLAKPVGGYAAATSRTATVRR